MVIFQMFFLAWKLYKSSLYITRYFGHRQCFIWEFTVLALKDTARLNSTSFRHFYWSGNDTVLALSYVCQVCKLKFLFWTIFLLICSYLIIPIDSFSFKYFITDIQPLHSGPYSLILSRDCGKFCFFRKIISKSYIYVSFLFKNQ